MRTRDIRFHEDVAAPPDRAYRALTSARELCLWWVERAETDARSLGKVRMTFPGGVRGRSSRACGVFVDLDPGRKVAWLWDKRTCRRSGMPPLVSVFLEGRGRRGSRVSVLHSGFPAARAADALFKSFQEGWEDFLAKLKLYLETGKTCKADLLSLEEARLLCRSGSGR